MNENQTTATETTTAAAPEVKKPLRQRLSEKYAALYEKYEKIATELQELAQEIGAIDALASIGEGSAVVVAIGKGETARSVNGVVLAVREEEDGTKLYKVQYGTGFDADITVVKAGKLSLPATPAAEAA